jgi:hypothetical protein
MRVVNTILVCAVTLWTIDFTFFDGTYFRSVWELLTLTPH